MEIIKEQYNTVNKVISKRMRENGMLHREKDVNK